MAERSKELLQVGFYLSKFGKKNPPATLGVTKWKDAYKLFYKSLSEGRSLTEFEHSLNNSRDGFDGYFPHTEREGWKGKDGLPSKLTGISLSTFEDFDNLNENEIYLKINKFINSEGILNHSRFESLDLLNIAFGYSWLYSLSGDQWNKLLDISKIAIENIVDDKDDPRLVISIRNDNNKRLAIIFGQKYVGGFYLEKEKPVVRFYIDADFNINEDSRFFAGDEGFADKKGKLIYCDLMVWKGQEEPLINRITNNLIDLFNNSGNSNLKRNHLSFMYDVILDDNTRQQFIDFTQLSPQLRLLETYRQYLVLTQNQDELYKWELGKKFKENWNLDAIDFSKMLSSIKLGNLLSQQSTSFYNLARKNPDDARQYFQFIFDDSNSIDKRIRDTNINANELLKKWHPSWTISGQDERTLSVFWAFNDMSNHAPYKSSFYTKYCSLIGVKSVSPREKYSDYLRLLNEFIRDYIEKDEALIKLHDSFLDSSKHISDPEHKLMAQNILYSILDGYWNPENSEDKKDISNDLIEIIDMKGNLNTILYGPPGTGKTYHINNLIERLESIKNESNSDLIILDELKNFWHLAPGQGGYLWPKLKEGDYLGYEWCNSNLGDLSKMDLNTQSIITAFSKVKKGDYFCVISGKKLLGVAKATHDYDYQKTIKNELWDFQTIKVEWIKIFEIPLLLNSTHTPSFARLNNGSRWESIKTELSNEGIFIGDSKTTIKTILKKNFTFTTFHQSTSYEDFIEGIKPIISENQDDKLLYSVEQGSFYIACDKAANLAGYSDLNEAIEDTKENRRQKFSNAIPFYYFIDEINRGNVSSIFGELITLIEDNKRLGAKAEILADLPYSNNLFGIPSNLYIIGTMNTADRSVEALDTALRRRFSFEEMLPKPELLKDKGENGSGKVGAIVLEELLTTINERIEALVDRDHTIGHAFFMEVDSLDSLRNVFANKVIPLLQEYFYGDYAKMEMVIGSDFFDVKESSKIIFAVKPEDFESIGKTYHIKNLSDKLAIPDEVLLAALNNMITGAN